MSALAASTGSINLGQGFPDTDGPSEVLEAAIDAIRAGVNQYPPGLGDPDLRRAIAEHQQRWYGLEVDPDTQVVVTAGATEALAGAMLGMLDAGDEVVLFEPMYDSYQAGIALAAATPVPVLLTPGVRRPLALRRRCALRRHLRSHEARVVEQPAQPDRQGVRSRRTGADRTGRDRPRPGRGHRRGVRAPRVRRIATRPAGDAAGDVRTDADHLVGRGRPSTRPGGRSAG